MSKHTKGPWKTKELMVYAEDGNGVTIASVNSEANARLIAAAPELLAACEEAQKAVYETINRRPAPLSTVCHSLEDAIVKATA